MAGKKQVIRRVEHANLADFDDQLWPINCALLVLAGFITGIIVATSSFDGGPFWKNGWFRLVLLAATMVALFAGTWWLHRKKHVRRMQLAVFLSLLLNLSVEMWLFRSYMYLLADVDDAATSEWIDEREELTLPDYGRQPTDQVSTEELERPVETVMPDSQPEQVQRQEAPQPPTPTRRATTESNVTASQPAPSALERSQAAISAPRRTDQPSGSQVSRQQRNAPTTPNEAIATPQPATAAPAQETPLNARATPLERSATGEPQLARQPNSQPPAPSAQASPSQPQLQRSDASNPTAANSPSAAASVARQAPQLPQSQPTPAETAATPITQPATASQVSPAASQVSRQQATAVSAAPPTPTLERPSTTQPLANSLARQQPSPDAPQNTAASPTTMARQTPAAATPAAAAPSVPATAATATPSQALQPAAAQVARQQAASPAASSQTANPSSAPDAASSAAQVARAAPSRAASTQTETAPAATSTGSVARSSSTAASVSASAQPTAAPSATTPANAPGELQASSPAANVARATTAAPAAPGAAPMAESAVSAAAQQVGPAQMNRAAQASTASAQAAPQAGQLGRTATSRSASTLASAAAAVPAAVVAEAGGTPSPSANAQATTLARSSGAVPLPTGTGPAQPAPGEALNTARGIAQATPRRAETSTDSSLASSTPGAGQLARSQGVASGAAAATAVPLQAPTAAAGSLSSQSSTAPQQTLTGVARATGQAPSAAPSPSTSDAGSGIAASGPTSAALSRADSSQPASAPQVGQGTASLARATTSAATSGAAMANAVDAQSAAVTATGDRGSIEAATGQVARQASTTAGVNGAAQGIPNSTASALPSVGAGSGPSRAIVTAGPVATSSGQVGAVARASAPSSTGVATAAEPVGAAAATSQVTNGVAANGAATSVDRQVASAASVSATGSSSATESGSASATVVGPQLLAAQRAESASPGSTTVAASTLTRSTSGSGAIDTRAETAAAAAPGSDSVPAAGTGNIAANIGTQGRQAAAALPSGLLARGDSSGETGPASATGAGGPATQRAEIGVGAGPQIQGAAPLTAGRQAVSAALPARLAAADEPGPVAGSASSDSSTLAGQGTITELTRQASGALPVQVAAIDGPGSLAETASPLPGLPNRRARPDAEAIHQVAQRFLLDRTAGAPSADARLFEKPAPAFLQRAPEQRSETARSRGGSAGSEKAVEMGLDYLAKQQLGDGRWSLQNVATGGTAQDAAVGAGQMQADTASTGLALLCFLGAGYTHSEGKYRDTVAAGVAHLVGNQKPDGDLFAGGSKYVWYYSHGIASIALCEAYGMTRDPELREPAQRALNFTLASQHPTYGGWRYAPQSSTDTSVSGWQIMALKSGELAGLSVPHEAYEKIGRWLDGAQTSGGTQYRYRPESQIAHQRNPSLAMTAEGLLMRLYTGWDRSNPQIVAGAEHLRQNLPSIGTRAQPLRDSYYWYYATQVMFQMQGEGWEAWNERLRTLLINSQAQSGPLAGSWDPRGAVPDRWGLEGGRLYVTAMHLLMLEVYYRHLPLYKID